VLSDQDSYCKRVHDNICVFSQGVSCLNKIFILMGEGSVTKECKHLYREFRVESSNGKVDRVWFYCQKCLEIVSKSIDSDKKRPMVPIKPVSTVTVQRI